MRSRVAIGIAAAVLAAMTAGAGNPASAAEGDGRVLLSLDGEHFSSELTGSLFPDQVVLIPGGRTSATIWVRNPAPMPAALTLAVADAPPSSLADALDLRAGTPGTSPGEPVSLGDDPCRQLLNGQVLQPEAATAVTIVLAMAADSTNEAQGSSASAELVFTLHDVVAGIPPVPVECRPPTVPSPPTDATVLGTEDPADEEIPTAPVARSTVTLLPAGVADSAEPEIAPAFAADDPVASSETTDGDPSSAPNTLALPEPPAPPLVAVGASLVTAGTAFLLLLLHRKRRRS